MGEHDVALQLELGDGRLALGAAGVAGDEHQVALLRGLARPAEEVARRERLALVVDAEERVVEAVAREVEVVGVAAERRHRELGGEHQPHVLEAPVAVEVEGAAVEEGDHVAADLVALAALALDRRLDLLQRRGVLRAGEALRRAEHAGGDVGDRDELVHLELRAPALGRRGRGVEPVLEVVALRGRELLDAAAGAVVVRHHQTLRRDEARRAPVREPDRGEAEVLEELGRGREAVGLLHRRGGEVVVEVHPLLGEDGGGCGRSEEKAQEGE